MSASISSVPHIFTLTGNLLAERTLEFEHWAPGKTQRARRESFQVGGKGINVSKMLTRLGVPNTALCFAGGAPGAECEAWLRTNAFKFHAFTSSIATRSGTVIRNSAAHAPETTFLGPDVAPDANAIGQCAGFLDAQAPGQLLVISGSIPGWSTAAFDVFRAALRRWTDKGILIVDTYGPPLADLVGYSPALLKINADELRSLGRSTLDELPRDIQHVIVTDGPRPVRIRERDGTLNEFTPPLIQEISPTGSGDVLLACVIEAMFVRKLPLPAAVAFAMPCASANAAHPGIAEFPPPIADS
jgi:fructose-1-phosphate kinase PfkB-like protein